MSDSRVLPVAAAAIESLVAQGQVAGVASLVWRRGQEIHAHCAGVRDLDDAAPMTRDTLFRIASMSKPITTIAALACWEEGRFALDDPITRWAPEFAAPRVLRSINGPLHDTDPAHRAITMGDLLTHRAGLTYGDFWPGPLADAYAALGGDIDTPLSPDAWMAALASLPLIAQPGTAFTYGHATDLLGVILARMEGSSLGDVLRRRVFAPLGLRDTAFTVPEGSRHRRAAACGVDDDGRLVARRDGPGGSFVHERPAHWTYESGGQGLWSTVDDVLRVARLFLGGGTVDGARVLAPDTVAMMCRDHLTPEERRGATMFGLPLFGDGHGFGLGVAVVIDAAQAQATLCRGHVGTVGWPGGFGGWWQADPADDSVAVLLTHSMVDIEQLARGLGLGAYALRAAFADAVARETTTA